MHDCLPSTRMDLMSFWSLNTENSSRDDPDSITVAVEMLVSPFVYVQVYINKGKISHRVPTRIFRIPLHNGASATL